MTEGYSVIMLDCPRCGIPMDAPFCRIPWHPWCALGDVEAIQCEVWVHLFAPDAGGKVLNRMSPREYVTAAFVSEPLLGVYPPRQKVQVAPVRPSSTPRKDLNAALTKEIKARPEAEIIGAARKAELDPWEMFEIRPLGKMLRPGKCLHILCREPLMLCPKPVPQWSGKGRPPDFCHDHGKDGEGRKQGQDRRRRQMERRGVK